MESKRWVSTDSLAPYKAWDAVLGLVVTSRPRVRGEVGPWKGRDIRRNGSSSSFERRRCPEDHPNEIGERLRMLNKSTTSAYEVQEVRFWWARKRAPELLPRAKKLSPALSLTLNEVRSELDSLPRKVAPAVSSLHEEKPISWISITEG